MIMYVQKVATFWAALAYYGTGEVGKSKTGCVDLFPFSEENLLKFKLQDVKKPDLIRALREARKELS